MQPQLTFSCECKILKFNNRKPQRIANRCEIWTGFDSLQVVLIIHPVISTLRYNLFLKPSVHLYGSHRKVQLFWDHFTKLESTNVVIRFSWQSIHSHTYVDKIILDPAHYWRSRQSLRHCPNKKRFPWRQPKSPSYYRSRFRPPGCSKRDKRRITGTRQLSKRHTLRTVA